MTPIIMAQNAMRGLVTDTNNTPLDGVEISFNEEAVKTKSNGQFIWSITDAPSKTIHFKIEKSGYYSESKKVVVEDALDTLLEIKLKPLQNPQSNYIITKVKIEEEVLNVMHDKWGDDFKHVQYPKQYLNRVITLNPGDDIQDAIDKMHDAGGGVVLLKSGIFETGDLIIKSRVTLCGDGRELTTIKHIGTGNFINQVPKKKLTDVVFKDLTFLGGSDTGSGLNLRGDDNDRHERLMWQNVTVKNMGSHGVGISRVNHIIMDNSIFQHNGTRGGLHHNIYFLFVGHVLQSDCDMSFPSEGKSNKYTSAKYVLSQRCVMKEGKGNGIQADNNMAGYLFFHKLYMSNFKRVALWFPCESYYNKFEYTEDLKWVPQHVILNKCEIVNNTWGAMWRIVRGPSYVINSYFDNTNIDMGLLKCDVKFEHSSFKTGNQVYTDIKQWPKDVRILW
ncbi:hypothetical protein FNB79_16250 [Formosa sediminum]|uniref:Right handed beta helix domain-containing protein n=1 Tax=Formosa sediminum TaxID=2594004 RepID=A0A516GVC9_9FLAO|nr:carboxypeptidase-like regulatory domain-containing protein [Formosa sediminum]QDO95456.1 hypothetical protein FNB79_16250 [Formosa sediminum]